MTKGTFNGIFAAFVLVLAAMTASAPVALAAAPPGADLVAADHSRGVGYAVLGRYELYTSSDGGSWNAAGLKNSFRVLSSVAAGRKVIFIGTADGQVLRKSGAAVEALTPPADPYGRRVAPIRYLAAGPDDKQLLISSGQGAVISGDGGQTWSAVADPFYQEREAREVMAVGFIKKTPVVITRFGPYKKGRKGFKKFTKGLPEKPDIVKATVQDGRMLISVLGQGVYYAAGTRSWKKLASTPGEPVSFAAFAHKGVLAARTASPINWGDDKGRKWTELARYTEGYLPVATLPVGKSTLILLRGKGLVSFDGARLTPVMLPDDLSRQDLVADLPTGRLAATQGGLFFSTDGGKSWRDVTPPALYTPVTSLLKLDDKRLLIGAAGSGVFMSEDGGNSWRPWLAGLGTANTIRGLAAYEGGVLAATENGLMWTAMGTRPAWKARDGGIGRRPLTDMAVTDGRILVSSFAGVFQSPGKGDFKPVKGLEGKVSRLAAAGKKVALKVDQTVLESSGGKASALPRLPDGAAPTDLAYVKGKLVAGSTAGVFVLDNGQWRRLGSAASPMKFLVVGLSPAPDGVRVLTGAGTFWMKF